MKENVCKIRLFENKSECSGCGACTQICPEKCIYMKYDNEGFLYPHIDQEKCHECGICIDTCQKINFETEAKRACYAVRNRDDNVCMASSSGGVFYSLAKHTIEKGGIVFGAAFTKNLHVKHIMASSIEEIYRIMGSKYVQSDIGKSYSKTKTILETGKNVLFTGTPCQILGLKKFLKKDYEKLLCLSVFCHGVPGIKTWDMYKSYCRGRLNNEELISIDFRDKREGWKDYHLTFRTLEHEISLRHYDSIYYKGFLENLFLRPSCYECPAKGNNDVSDIIIGDYWGIEKHHPDFDDIRGVSAVIIKSKKGEDYFDNIKKDLYIIPSKYEYIKTNNPVIEVSAKGEKRERFFFDLNSSCDFYESVKYNIKSELTYEIGNSYKYPLIKKYLSNVLNGWSALTFFERFNFNNIAVYALNDLAELLWNDLSYNKKDMKNIIFADKNSDKFKSDYHGSRVLSIDDIVKLYEGGKVDCIVICSPFHENSIIDDFIKKGISPKICISYTDIVYFEK